MPIEMDDFRKAVRYLLDRTTAGSAIPDGPTRMCVHFLQRLQSTPGSPSRAHADRGLGAWYRDVKWRDVASLFLEGSDIIEAELANAERLEPDLGARLSRLASSLPRPEAPPTDPPPELIERFWAVFMPDAVGVRSNWEHRTRELRQRRMVDIESLCSEPIRSPGRELLWTSNVLLTVPDPTTPARDLRLEPDLRRRIEAIDPDKQTHWYDHPVPIGVAPEQNELLHGLGGIAEMLRFEKERRMAGPADRLAVALSVSVTHSGLETVAREYIQSALTQKHGLGDLDVYVFTEADTRRLLEEFLTPAAKLFDLDEPEPDSLAHIFGVDGPYARHYNFLKAISALWQAVRDPALKATYKFDLDQVFPQENLVRELGRSAFELLTTPIWGATGRDQEGNSVELGMVAGALVNQSDIGRGLFTPDVTLPHLPLPPDRWVFPTQVPQALSTAAEMMARDNDDGGDGPDGKRTCLSRFHVTGGTTGIRVDALRRYRPFAYSRISRAEDQAYVMPVLYQPGPPYLRYAHVPGLIMRHDKQGLVDEAMRTAAAGKTAGDYERMILFSHLAEALPWSRDRTRAALGPFTGSFIQPIGVTLALLAFALRILSLKNEEHAEDLLRIGSRRLGPLLSDLQTDPDWVRRTHREELGAWNAFYDVLNHLEQALEAESAEARRLSRRADAILEATKVNVS